MLTGKLHDLFTFDFDTTIGWASTCFDRISPIALNPWTPTIIKYLHLLRHLPAAANLGKTQFGRTLWL